MSTSLDTTRKIPASVSRRSLCLSVEAAKLAVEDEINIKCLATPTRLRCQTKWPSISQRYGIAKSTIVENEAVSLKGNHRQPRGGSTLLTGFDRLPLSIRECTDDVVRCSRFLYSYFSPEASLSRSMQALTGQCVSFLVQDVLYQRGTYLLKSSLVLWSRSYFGGVDYPVCTLLSATFLRACTQERLFVAHNPNERRPKLPQAQQSAARCDVDPSQHSPSERSPMAHVLISLALAPNDAQPPKAATQWRAISKARGSVFSWPSKAPPSLARTQPAATETSNCCCVMDLQKRLPWQYFWTFFGVFISAKPLVTVDASCTELKVGGASFLPASRSGTVDANGSNLSEDLLFLITVSYLLCFFQELESEWK